MPDPRDPRGVRHALVVVLALTACAVPAGAPPPSWRWVSGSPTPRRPS
ncbi:transposase family protein [Streptomyces netropsis]|nr:transposase family protein [Streptomyces netropsis]